MRFLITNLSAPVNLPIPTPSFPLSSLTFLQTNSSSHLTFMKNTCSKTKLHQERLDVLDDPEKKIESKITNL